MADSGDVGGRARDRVAGLTRGEHLGVRQVPRAPRVGYLILRGPVGGYRHSQSGLEGVGGDGQQEPETERLHDDGAQVIGERHARLALGHLRDQPCRPGQVELQARPWLDANALGRCQLNGDG
jgi:hypothetical protein